MNNHEKELKRIDDAIFEATRFLRRAKAHLAELVKGDGYSMPSRAAMKRSALDLKVALNRINKSIYE